MTLGQRVSERSNLITPMRLALAAIVAVWHAFIISGSEASEIALNGLSPSYMAVNGFFILSGFLIAQSADKRDLAYYAAARILRLYPALIALMAWGLAFAALMHLTRTGPAGESGTWLYPLQSLVFLNASGSFPSLFSANPETAFSLSVWTLRYEAMAYMALPAVAALGLLARPLRVWALWALPALAFAAVALLPETPAFVAQSLRLGAAFLVGTAIYASRDKLRAGPAQLAATVCAAALLYSTPLFEAAANLVLAWVLFAICFAPAKGPVPALSRMPDWSYGLYIWHWPIFQTLKLVFPGADWTFLLAAGFPISLAVAAMSWSFVERPALAGKERLAAFFRRLLPRPAATAAAA